MSKEIKTEKPAKRQKETPKASDHPAIDSDLARELYPERITHLEIPEL